MIISNRHKFIFAAIPKTGTHSVRQALREQMGEDDLEQVGLFVNKRFPFEEMAKIRHGHITLSQIRPFLEPSVFDSYLKFAFVRNPYDRFVSYCAFMTREKRQFLSDPKSVMHYFLFHSRPDSHILFQPQHTFVVDGQGQLLADYVGRVEEMQGSYDTLCEKIGVPSRPLDKVNGSERADYRSYYDKASMDGVREYYRKDFELFGYEF